jgi:hypothetical protein
MTEATIMVHTPTKDIMSKPLAEATVQEIQLELIRRRHFHAFDGQRIADCLIQHRDLWEAVMMDRLAISHPGSLPTMGLMKLRDFPKDEWNVDTLYILAPSKADAEKLAEILNKRQWGGLVDVHTDPEEVDNALGGARPGQAIVSIWWD